MKVNEVKVANGSKVKSVEVGSEHKLYQGNFYGYACIETEDNKQYYVPYNYETKEIDLNIEIWDFIKELPTIS